MGDALITSRHELAKMWSFKLDPEQLAFEPHEIEFCSHFPVKVMNQRGNETYAMLRDMRIAFGKCVLTLRTHTGPGQWTTGHTIASITSLAANYWPLVEVRNIFKTMLASFGEYDINFSNLDEDIAARLISSGINQLNKFDLDTFIAVDASK